jgi:hypothetical protein
MSELIKCKACSKEFESEGSLHKHLKAHKLRMAAYYQKYYPRFDGYDDKIIKFKSKRYYFETDFNSRRNLKLWLTKQPENIAKDYCRNKLADRIKEKDIKYSPTEVELRSLMFPPITYLHKLFGNYYRFCEKELGLKNKYTIFPKRIYTNDFHKEERKIFVDTREQKPLKFDLPIEVKTLNFGDYAFSHEQNSCNTYIERKSIGDFVGTLSGGLERFEKEIVRSMENDAYLIILIEDSLDNCKSFPYLPHVSKKIKATPEFIFHNVRSLIQKYPTIQFLFVNGRKEASRVVQRIFSCKCFHQKIDLQLAYDAKIL